MDTSFNHSHKKWTDSLEDSLDQVLFAVGLEFPKIQVPRLPQHTSNVSNECAGKSEWSKQLYSLAIFDQLLGALIHLNFIILILFLIDDTWCKLCNNGCSSVRTMPGVSLYQGLTFEENIVAVIIQDRVIDDNLKSQIKNQTLCTCRLFLLA